ncbi:MAG: response regulator [Desulfuromonas sp.]|nr:response regulator [Desulfuromonas sp.]
MVSSQTARDIFFEEAEEHLTILEGGLLQLEDSSSTGAKTELIDKLFRSAHTLKGAAALLKFNTISQISHELENLLESYKSGTVVLTAPLLDAMLASLDTMRNLLQMTHLPDYEQTSVLFGLQACQMLQAAQSGELQQEAAPRTESARQFSNSVKVGVDKIDQMMNLLGEMTITKTHLLDQLRSFETMKDEIDFARERLLGEVANFAESYEYTNPEEKGAEDSESIIADFEELEFDRYDELNLFSRKLHEISNDINEAVGSIRQFFGQVSVDVDAIDRMTSEMKERISEIRTLPVDELYQRFKRTIRNLSLSANKPVELRLSGGETRLGRTIIDGLFDPLLHVLRNAVAHGIEEPEQRVAANKPETGVIKINTVRRGNYATITISDDGGGLQFKAIREKAIALGWIDEKDHLEQQDYIDMIFRAGFSTKEQADDTSGRGVGMDVVLDRLSDLNGTIEVKTEVGKGTEFILNIPLSLIIINVIQFRLGKQLFVLPSSLIEEIQEIGSLQIVDDQVMHHGENYRIVDLNNKFNLSAIDTTRQCVVFVRSLGARLGMLVEEIVSQEDIVIRPFGKLLADMPCFSGTSVSGGGAVRLVVNPTRLLQVVDKLDAGVAEPSTINADTLLPHKQRAPRVLVVDDSLSVRKYASMILEANGIDYLTATNGAEALAVLDEESVDLILTDLEMPVMHGYELLAEIKRRVKLRNIPVAVITSRSGSQHQEKAFNLGAVNYLVKPFDEDALLDLIREHTLFSI